MKKKTDTLILENDFNQKKINHIVHYLDNFESLLKILKNGISPSYCLEKINDFEYYIPMISFCNIPFKNVDEYMRYGKYGIGMSLDWALKNSISPVVYIHETTPFRKFSLRLNRISYKYENNWKDISDITIEAMQFFKNWKVTYKGTEIITYHEREWRYIPELQNEKILDVEEFENLKKNRFKNKPHLPEYTLDVTLKDIKYILINNETQRKKVLNILLKKFGQEAVIDAILLGQLMIIDDDIIRNDF